MPAKKGLPAPIDRPLSRAYLRKFIGWSTAYPPGVSDPTSLRIMENLLINREGTVRLRPGLRMLTRMANGTPTSGLTLQDSELQMVGTHEAFYLNDGRKAYLFAVKETELIGGVPVGVRTTFRVASVPPNGDGTQLHVYTLAEAGFDTSDWPDSTPFFTAATMYVKYLQIDNKILALSNAGEEMIVFHVGETKKVAQIQAIEYPTDPPPDMPGTFMVDCQWVTGPQNYYPDPAPVPKANSIWSSDGNPYNFGFFYTYSSLLGESEPSGVRVVELKRPFGAWGWWPTTAGISGEAPEPWLTEPPVSDPKKSADQYLVGIGGSQPHKDAFAAAVEAGATAINFYMFSWSKQDSVPVEAMLIGSNPLDESSTWDAHSWMVMNPGTMSLGYSVPVPNKNNRYNSTKPSTAGQGLVAADRLILVNDPLSAGVIRWTTNEQGNYLNFAPGRGGGYKTLTSGNMQVPACAKLWQNPQSADTITVLCMGTDGHSSSYYMQPAQVASQSDATNIMGFEETTATPGTVSPYGVEVANNALYHPLDDQLMKSTASNYNISHKSQTDKISNMWRRLADKHHIVSSYHDQRLYYLVHNPAGAALEEGCWGNEVWVLDQSSEGGAWSRWLTQGQSLRKIEHQGKVLMSLARPEGLYAFDEDLFYDDYQNPGELIQSRPIGWKLETNTQGANRAHDAWAHLQQVGIVLGDFYGSIRWGIRGWDLHGREIDRSKVTHEETAPEIVTGGLPHDIEDQLAPRRDMKEWYFYASSEPDEFGNPLPFAGQINLVQYRYTPVSVNVGYEHGSVETFEYGRDAAHLPVTDSPNPNWSSTTANGVPLGANDPGRP